MGSASSKNGEKAGAPRAAAAVAQETKTNDPLTGLAAAALPGAVSKEAQEEAKTDAGITLLENAALTRAASAKEEKKAEVTEEKTAGANAKLNATAKAEARFVVVGMSGHGKSTFLNACVSQADESADCEVFAVAVSSEPCTKEIDASTLTLKETWADTLEAKDWAVVDSVGFPDTDKNKVAASYDDVVSNVLNAPQGLNALVWIVKADRGTDLEIESIYVENAKFMKELSRVQCKLVMIINGNENFQGAKYKALKQKGKLDEEKDKVRQQLRAVADKLVKSIGISTVSEDDIYTSIDIEDLQEEAPKWLFTKLQGSKKVPSDVKKSTMV